MTSCPVSVTTLSSSIGAARHPPPVRGRPECFQCEDHSRLNCPGTVERNETADDRLFPNSKADTVTVLQSKACFFVRKTELLGFGPYSGNLRRRAARAHQRDGGIQVVPAAFVSIHHGVRRVAYGEATVITGAVPHVGMQYVVIHGVTRAKHAI